MPDVPRNDPLNFEPPEPDPMGDHMAQALQDLEHALCDAMRIPPELLTPADRSGVLMGTPQEST